MRAYVRARTDAGVQEHPVTIVEEPVDGMSPAVIDVPDFGLYGVGRHPELGAFAVFLVPTPGCDPEPALCQEIENRFEVQLVSDALHLVVEDYPGAPDPDGPVAVADSPGQPTAGGTS